MLNKVLLLLSVSMLLLACSSTSSQTPEPEPMTPPAESAPPQAHAHHTSAPPKTQTQPYQVSVKALTPLKPNQASQLELNILNAAGQSVKHTQFKIMHGERVHTLILDPSLVDYQHLHMTPQEGDSQAAYRFQFTPTRAGTYKIYLDVVDLKNKHYYLESQMNVPGQANTAKLDKTLPKGKIQSQAEVAGLSFTTSTQGQIKAKQHVMLEITVKQGDQLFRKLEPTMEAYAHLVGFNADRSEIIHTHPMGEEPRSSNQRGGPNLHFGIEFPHPGFYRLFLQVRVEGKDLFIPFDVNVA